LFEEVAMPPLMAKPAKPAHRPHVYPQPLLDKVADAQANSTAADIATLKADFNALLAKLRAAGLMLT
jgi:hypothetical protein